MIFFVFFSQGMKFNTLSVLVFAYCKLLTVLSFCCLMKLSWSKKMVRKFFNIKCKTEDSQADAAAYGGRCWFSSNSLSSSDQFLREQQA